MIFKLACLLTFLFTLSISHSFDNAHLRRGSRVSKACASTCCGSCEISFYQHGMLSSSKVWKGATKSECTSNCDALIKECRFGCSQAVSIDTVETLQGCGCTAKKNDIVLAKKKCLNDCDTLKKECVTECADDDQCKTHSRIAMDWQYIANGSCDAVCNKKKQKC